MKVQGGGGVRCRVGGSGWGMLGKESWSARGGERFWEKGGTGGRLCEVVEVERRIV